MKFLSKPIFSLVNNVCLCVRFINMFVLSFWSEWVLFTLLPCFRRLRSLEQDIRYIAVNARLFNQPASQIVRNSRVLVETLIRYLRFVFDKQLSFRCWHSSSRIGNVVCIQLHRLWCREDHSFSNSAEPYYTF